MHIKEFSTRVVMFKLAAALEKYEMDLRRLAKAWRDAALFRRLQDEFCELRMLGASVPRLSVAWVAVLVSRTRLVQALRRGCVPSHADLQEHLKAIDALRKRCLRSIGAQSVVLT